MRVVLMSGRPKSGKSTYIRKYFPDATVISTDNIRMGLFGVWWHKPLEFMVWDAVYKLLTMYCDDSDILPKGDTLVIDATSLSSYIRRKHISVCKEFGIPIECVVLDTPMIIVKERNKRDTQNDYKPIPNDIFNRLCNEFTMPHKEEGFDKVTIVKDFFGKKSNGKTTD